MSVNIIKMVMANHDLKGPVKAVALVLAEHAHKDGSETYPSLSLIEVESGYSRRTVQRAIQELLDRRVITKTKNWTPRQSNHYRFLAVSEWSERPHPSNPVWSQRHLRVVRVTPQSGHSDTLTIKEPLDNQLRRAKNSSDPQSEISFSDNQLKAKAARELLEAQRRARRRITADS